MIDYSEKRDFLRLPIDCELSFSLAGSSIRHEGNIINLSSKGILFTSSERFDQGTVLDILLISSSSDTPQMEASATVSRVIDCPPVFEVACKINDIS